MMGSSAILGFVRRLYCNKFCKMTADLLRFRELISLFFILLVEFVVYLAVLLISEVIFYRELDTVIFSSTVVDQ